jgi:hypothetical protein
VPNATSKDFLAKTIATVGVVGISSVLLYVVTKTLLCDPLKEECMDLAKNHYIIATALFLASGLIGISLNRGIGRALSTHQDDSEQ